MPMHDWTRVDDGLFHDFYLSWVLAISSGLNHGRLPRDFYALVERHPMDVDSWERGVPDGELPGRPPVPDHAHVIRLEEVPPATPIRDGCQELAYWRNARSITVRSAEDDLAVAVVEVVTPAVKWVPVARRRFIDQMGRAVFRGIHLLIVDPFADREGQENTIADLWQSIRGRPLALPVRAATLAAISASPEPEVFADAVSLGNALPDMPLFLDPESYVLVDLEAAYRRAWDGIAVCVRDEVRSAGDRPSVG